MGNCRPIYFVLCLKYTLIASNVILLITLLSVSCYQAASFVLHDDLEMLGSLISTIEPACIFTAATIFIMGSLAGFFCISWASYKGIVLYTLMLVLILITETVVLSLKLTDKTVLKANVAANLKRYLHTYKSDLSTRTRWDQLQGTFECCGINSHVDWRGEPYETENGKESALPTSCCKNATLPCDTNSSGFHAAACPDAVTRTYRTFSFMDKFGYGFSMALLALVITFSFTYAELIRRSGHAKLAEEEERMIQRAQSQKAIVQYLNNLAKLTTKEAKVDRRTIDKNIEIEKTAESKSIRDDESIL